MVKGTTTHSSLQMVILIAHHYYLFLQRVRITIIISAFAAS